MVSYIPPSPPPNTRPIIGISSSSFVSFNLGDSGIGTGCGCGVGTV
jgi:hypothetical protein